MARLKTYLLAAATMCAALAIGFFMQGGIKSPAPEQLSAPDDVVISDITYTSSAAPLRLPSQATLNRLPGGTIQLAAASADPVRAEPLPQSPAMTPQGCDISFSARTTAGAVVELALEAPCYGSERVTIHHHGLMFTEITEPDGSLRLSVPALSEHALFIASFDNNDGATTTAEVPALPFYDRVALLWRGNGGVQLHAREYDADYFTEGHVWAAQSGDLSRVAEGRGGFLTRLGDPDAPEALMAEVYSFPAGTAKQAGTVAVSVEAEVTAANCGREIEAETLERRAHSDLVARDLVLNMPDCDGVGDFLVLKNLIEDLKIAAR